MLESKIPISQSLLKDLRDYLIDCNSERKLKRTCGLQIKAKYVDNLWWMFDEMESDVKKLGKYFEYMATGAPAKGGKIPKPEYVTRGVNKGELKEAYQRMANHVPTYTRWFESKKYTEFLVSPKLTRKLFVEETNKQITAEGHLDGLGKANGLWEILDLKTSGLLTDRWNEFGWHPDFVSHKPRIMTQPLHYVWLCKDLASIKLANDIPIPNEKEIIAELKAQETIPFTFLVFSNTNVQEVAEYDVVLDKEDIDTHHVSIIAAEDAMAQWAESNLWTAFPAFDKCLNCPLKDCASRTDLPTKYKVEYTTSNDTQ